MDPRNVTQLMMSVTRVTVGQSTPSPDVPDFNSLPLVQLSVWIWIICLPVLFILGVFGNVMTIVIVRRFQDNRSALDRYFLCLAVTDLCVNVTGQLPDWLTVVTETDAFAVHDIVCKMDFFIMNAAGTCSAWLVVVMVTHRAMSVMWPHRVNVLCTPKTSCCVTGSLLVVIVLAKSHLLYGMEVSDGVCLQKQNYQEFLVSVWTKIDLVLSSALPFCCLLVSNVVLVVKLRTSVKEAGDQFAATDRQQSVRERKVNSITLTALTVSVAFIVFTLPLTAMNVVSTPAIGSLGGEVSDAMALNYLLQYVCICLYYFNYSMNFYLYCLTGQRFRKEFLQLLKGTVACSCPSRA